MQRNFRFYKTEKGEWFVDLPEWSGDPGELQMVEGADMMLDMISDNGEECELLIGDEKIDDGEMLTLIHARDQQFGGGGDYLLETFRGDNIHLKMWLCGVTEFVFGKLPQKLWFKEQHSS